MKKHRICGAFWVMLVLMCAAAAWAGEQPASTDRTPAILASLDSGSAIILDDQSAMAVRGKDGAQYKYVLVKILGVNALDYGSGGFSWTWNPLGFRYGAWGGPGWTNGGTPADKMDEFFMAHDIAYETGFQTKLKADQELVANLSSLPNSQPGFWGTIYLTNAPNVKDWVVYVSGMSLFGGKSFFCGDPCPTVNTRGARRWLEWAL